MNTDSDTHFSDDGPEEASVELPPNVDEQFQEDRRTKVRQGRYRLKALEGVKHLVPRNWRLGSLSPTADQEQPSNLPLPPALRPPTTTVAAAQQQHRQDASEQEEEEESVTPVGAFRVSQQESFDGESIMTNENSVSTEMKMAAAASLDTPVKATLVQDDSEKLQQDPNLFMKSNSIIIVQAQKVEKKPWYKVHRIQAVIAIALIVLTGVVVGLYFTIRQVRRPPPPPRRKQQTQTAPSNQRGSMQAGGGGGGGGMMMMMGRPPMRGGMSTEPTTTTVEEEGEGEEEEEEGGGGGGTPDQPTELIQGNGTGTGNGVRGQGGGQRGNGQRGRGNQRSGGGVASQRQGNGGLRGRT